MCDNTRILLDLPTLVNKLIISWQSFDFSCQPLDIAVAVCVIFRCGTLARVFKRLCVWIGYIKCHGIGTALGPGYMTRRRLRQNSEKYPREQHRFNLFCENLKAIGARDYGEFWKCLCFLQECIIHHFYEVHAMVRMIMILNSQFHGT